MSLVFTLMAVAVSLLVLGLSPGAAAGGPPIGPLSTLCDEDEEIIEGQHNAAASTYLHVCLYQCYPDCEDEQSARADMKSTTSPSTDLDYVYVHGQLKQDGATLITDTKYCYNCDDRSVQLNWNGPKEPFTWYNAIGNHQFEEGQ